MVDEDGNQLFNIENVGKLSLENLLKNNSVTKHTKVLTDSGNQNWGISLLKS